MSNFLRNLVTRELGRAEVVEPRPVSRFEPPPAAFPPRARAAPHGTDGPDAPASEEIEITTEPAPHARPRPDPTAPTRPAEPDAATPTLGATTPVTRERDDSQPRSPSDAARGHAPRTQPEDAASARPTADLRTSSPHVVAQPAESPVPRAKTAEPVPTPPPLQNRKAGDRDADTRAPDVRQGRGVEHEGRLRPPTHEREEVVEPIVPPVASPRPAPRAHARDRVGEEINPADPPPRRAAPSPLRADESREGGRDAKRAQRDAAPVEAASRVEPAATRPRQRQTESARRPPPAERQSETAAALRARPIRSTVEQTGPPRPARPQELTQGTVARPRVARPAERGAARNDAAQPAPVINVTIGRVEVRANAGASAAQQRREGAQSSPAPLMSLDDYLRQRAGGGGGGR